LGVSERTFRRYEEEGEAGLWDRRLGKASCKRVPVDRAEEVERLYRERYQGFTVKHFHEHLVKDQAMAGATPGRSCIFSWRGWWEGAAQGGAPAQARAASAAGHDAAPGRLEARLARRPGGLRPDRDDGRRHGRDLFGVFWSRRKAWHAKPTGVRSLYSARDRFVSYDTTGQRFRGWNVPEGCGDCRACRILALLRSAPIVPRSEFPLLPRGFRPRAWTSR
jgi:hypothetical protein